MPSPDQHGLAALMLCESLMHVLVEEGILPKGKALDAINTVAELMHELDHKGPSLAARPKASELIDAIAATFAAKD
jgi:hypothetical protein